MAEYIYVMNDSDKDFLNDQYAHLEFVDDVNDYRCVRCYRVAIGHYYSSCDHLFCRNCKNVLSMEMDNSWLCPQCNRAVSQIGRQKLEVEKKINILRVRCLNRKYGCQQILELSELPNHCKTCTNTRQSHLLSEMSGSNLMEGILLRQDKITDRLDAMTEFLIQNRNELEAKLGPQFGYINVNGDLQTEDITIEIRRSLGRLTSDFRVEIDQMKTDIDKKIAETNITLREWMKLQTMSFASATSENAGHDDSNQLAHVLTPVENDYLLQTNIQQQMSHEETKQLLIKVLDNQKETRETLENSIRSLSLGLETVKNEIKSIRDEPIRSFETRPKLSITRKHSKVFNRRSREQLYNHYTSANVIGHFRSDTALHSALNDVMKPNDGQSTDDSYKWEISNFKDKLVENEKLAILSSTFPLNSYPFGCQAKLEYSRQVFLLSVCFKDLVNDEKGSGLDVKPLPRVTYTLCDVQTSGTADKKNRIRVKDYLFQEKLVNVYDRFYYEELLGYKANILTNRYVQKNMLQIQISMTSPPPPLSNNGTLVWKMDHYQKKRQMVKDEYIISVQGPGYFYTAEKGYRVKAELSWDQMDKLYTRISFVTGEFDSELPKSFHHQTTVTLFDQLTRQHFVIRVVKDIKLSKWYNIDLMSNSAILQGNYLKDGSLLIKIAIEPHT